MSIDMNVPLSRVQRFTAVLCEPTRYANVQSLELLSVMHAFDIQNTFHFADQQHCCGTRMLTLLIGSI
jgi:hypothetical protein